ncbi:34157_t:CDS:2, partial [Racocetra persica]
PIWDAFKKTGLHDLKTRQYPIQCNYCNKDFDRRVDAIYIHIIDHCKDILQPNRFKFIELQAKKTTASCIKSKSIDNDDQDSDSLKFCKDLILIFDGWTTISNSSVYAFFAITSYGDIHMLGLEEFENQCHTSKNIANITIKTINKIGLNIEQFSWIVTDSPN